MEAQEAMEKILKEELDTDSPETLFKQLALVESLAYLACKKQAQQEVILAQKEQALAKAKEQALAGLEGTALEKNIKVESLTADAQAEVTKAKAAIAYWKQTGRIIENKISLGQSVLANITSQIKANQYFNNIK